MVHSYWQFGPENDPYLSQSDLSNLRMVKWVGVKLWLPPPLPTFSITPNTKKATMQHLVQHTKLKH